MLLMLEDDAERIERFTRTLQLIDSQLPLKVWRDAPTLIREIPQLLSTARLISLDHDLEPIDQSADDPGTGWNVAQFLAAQPPVCPVIIHSSNRERANWMLGEFELGGWKFASVAPIGDDWIEQDWRHVVCKHLLRR